MTERDGTRAPIRSVYRCCYESPLTSIAVAGRIIVAAAKDNNVRLLDLDSGVLLKTIDQIPRYVTYATPLDDTRVVLGMTTRWGVLDTRNAKIADIGDRRVGFSYFGKVLLPARIDDGHISGFEGPPAWRDRRFAAEAQLDHARIVYLDEDDDGPPWDQTFRVWDFVAGKELRWFDGAPAEARLLCAIDAHSVISVHADRTFRIWNVEDGKLAFEIKHEHDFVHAIDVVAGRWLMFSAEYSEAFVAAVGERRRFTVNLWDLQTRTEVGRLYEPHRLIALARADDGRLCALDDRGCIRLIAYTTDAGQATTREATP